MLPLRLVQEYDKEIIRGRPFPSPCFWKGGGGGTSALERCEDGGITGLLRCENRLLIRDSYTALPLLERVVVMDGGLLSVLEACISDGRTTLHIAAGFRNATLAKILLPYDKALELVSSKGASGDLRFRFRNGSTSLHLAIDTGNHLVVKALFEGGVDVNSLDDSREAPLHNSAMRGPKGIIEMLLNRGARIDAKDFEQITPL